MTRRMARTKTGLTNHRLKRLAAICSSTAIRSSGFETVTAAASGWEPARSARNLHMTLPPRLSPTPTNAAPGYRRRAWATASARSPVKPAL